MNTEEAFFIMEIILRPWCDSDKENLVKNANNKVVSQYLTDIFPYPYTMKNANEWIALTKTFDPKKVITYCICVNGEAVGGIELRFQSDVFSKTGILGYWLGENFWSKGIMSKAIQQVCEEGFSKFELERIEADVFSPNEGSKNVLKRNGFLLEGICKNAVCKNENLYHTYVFALLKEDFYK